MGAGALTADISLQAAQICDARLDAEIAAGRSVTVETVLSSDKLKRRVESRQGRRVQRSTGLRDAASSGAERRARAATPRPGRARCAVGPGAEPARTVACAVRMVRTQRADIVLVFDNTAAPVYAAGKADGDVGSGRPLTGCRTISPRRYGGWPADPYAAALVLPNSPPSRASVSRCTSASPNSLSIIVMRLK